MIIQGNALHLPIADNTVQCCVTSPPYYGLRDYGTAKWQGGDPNCDHLQTNDTRDRADVKQVSNAGTSKLGYKDICGKCGAIRIDDQIGLESTPDEYVAKLVAVFREVKRVLKDDGVVFLNLGDSYYTTNPGSGGKTAKQSSNRGSFHAGFQRAGAYGTSGKEPVSYTTAYHLKPKDLIGIPWMAAFALRADGWYLRSDIIWHKPNPMPESVKDRPTKAHEYVFLLSKSARYYYDNEAVMEDAAGGRERFGGAKYGDKGLDKSRNDTARFDETIVSVRNKRSVWTITTQPFKGAHFAVMPEKLVEPCVLAGSRVGDIVLDPFAGSGTVGVVAQKLGRAFIGIELNPEYVKLAEARLIATPVALPMGVML